MSADWSSFFNMSGTRAASEDPRSEGVEDEAVEPDQGNGP